MATLQLHHKQRYKKRTQIEPTPQEFIDDCKDLAPDFEKTKPKVDRIYKKWLARGKKPKTIGAWLRTQLKQWYSKDGVTQLIPQDARRTYVKNGSYSRKLQGLDVHEFGKNQNANTSSTQESQKETEKIGAIRTEPLKTHEVGRSGKTNQGPDEYEIERLDEYDKDYLVEIIKWLHKNTGELIQEAFKWQARFDIMRAEKAALVKQVEELRKKIE